MSGQAIERAVIALCHAHIGVVYDAHNHVRAGVRRVEALANLPGHPAQFDFRSVVPKTPCFVHIDTLGAGDLRADIGYGGGRKAHVLIVGGRRLLVPATTDIHAIERAFARNLARFAAWAERFAPWIASAVLAGIVFIAVVNARFKPLWLDEIMGVMIAKLPSTADIWEICKSGADNQPPLYHYAMHASIRLFGNDELGLRLPSIAGYALFCVSLYWFVGRCTSRLYGLIAMLFPCLTKSWYYATEGRPYALVLACAGAAALCWQSVIRDYKRRWMLFGLGLTLACAFNLHYYSALLFVPFAIAELVRTYETRIVDRAVWLALTAPFLVLLPYLPIIRESRVKSGIPDAYFARPGWYGSLDNFANQVLGSSLVALVAISCIYLIFQMLELSAQAEPEKPDAPKQTTFIPETILVLGFTCLPIFGIALSKFVTHIFFIRYVMAAVFGIAALIAIGLWRAFSGRREPALAVLLILAGVFVHAGVWDLKQAMAQQVNPPKAALQHVIPSTALGDNLPIVVADPDEFMMFSYYVDGPLHQRVYYVSSEELAMRFVGFTFLERMMIASAPYFGTKVIDYNTFVATHPKFYVLGGTQWWFVPKLISEGAHLQLLKAGPSDKGGGSSEPFFFVETARR
jgi:hypothetical protein